MMLWAVELYNAFHIEVLSMSTSVSRREYLPF
jgi:hypothetical protein